MTNIEPGLTDTELGSHVDNPDLAAQLGAMFAGLPALGGEDIADFVAYATTRPRHVDFRQVVLLPTQQA
jgi:NADP-dependent 3-hydroxy acid dehydrogenase YdfG